MILQNIQKNYPSLTLISVTQKIAAVEHYDKIILLMQGEMIGIGTHEELMQAAPNMCNCSTHSKAPAIMNYNLNQLSEAAAKNIYLSALKKLLQLISAERRNLLLASGAILLNSALNLIGSIS